MFKQRFAVLGMSLCLLASAVQAQTVATVNGVKIPQARLNVLSKGQKLTADQERAAKETLIRAEILSQAARRKNLQQNPEVVTMIELQTQEILANAYIADYARTVTVSDAEVRKFYNEQNTLLGDKEYKVRHILVKNDAEARGIIDQLKKGGNFSTIAQQKSIDRGSAANGGQLDWVPGAIFDNAINNVPKGSYTQTPVQTPAGYHVVLVEDIRPFTKPSFEEAKPQLTQMLRAQKVQEHVEQLRQQAKIQ